MLGSLDRFQASDDLGQTVSLPWFDFLVVDRDLTLHVPCIATASPHLYQLPKMNTLNSLYNFVESWVEISSQPSSSSISSAATDHSTAAARPLEPSAFARRRRRLNRTRSLPYQSLVRPASTAGSSQEEYEESESESDQVMTSSNEGLVQHPTTDIQAVAATSSASEAASEAASAEEEEEDDDDDDGDNGTALGILTTESAFTPQPNVFSHPPQSQSRRAYSEEPQMSYFQHRRQSSSKPAASSYPDRKNHTHTPYNMISPSHQADHDAALRASLSTLLSCAAAARCLPRKEQASAEPVKTVEDPPRPPTPRSVAEPGPAEHLKLHQRPHLLRVSTSSLHSLSSSQKPKRKASTSKERQSMKRKRRSSFDETLISPTLMTWMVSAGVVAIFSAISFSAGYVLGKEVGRLEAAGGAAFPGGNNCGKEMGRGLKRLRWSSSNSLLKA